MFGRRAARRARAQAEAEAQQQHEHEAARRLLIEQAGVFHWRGTDRPAYHRQLRVLRSAAPDVRDGGHP